MNLGVLYREELKALVRGRFAWVGGAVVLLSIGGLAAVATQDTWLDGYGIVAYFLAPLGFVPIAAASIAGPRANRFVESVFTAPVERSGWFAAKVLVLLTLAIGYYVALIPMMLVYVANVGLPFLLIKFVEWTPGILLASVATGTLIGVLFIGRTVAPPVATGVGVLMAFACLVPLQELLVAQGYGAKATGRLTLASPLVLLKNGLGFTLVAGSIPASTALTWLSFLFVVAGSFALAAWVFLRAQGVELWEATRVQRWSTTGALFLITLLPVFLADANYDVSSPPANNAPSIHGVFSRGGGTLALVDPGGPMPDRCCDVLLNRDRYPPFPTDQTTKQDLLVLLPVDTSQPLVNLAIQITGDSGLQATADAKALAEIVQHLEKRNYASDSGPTDVDDHHISSGWVARVPISLTPTNPWDIGGDRYPLNVTATYTITGDSEVRTFTAGAGIEAQVPYALAEMGGAAAILPLLCLIAALLRWRQTR